MEFCNVAQTQGLTLRARFIVKHGPGIGSRRDVEKEVIHASLQLSSASGSTVITSDDPLEPHCFHPSRRQGLDIAKKLRSQIRALGFAGPAVSLRIPGIPFAQEQDVGLHVSLYNRAKDATDYNPPDMEACARLEGQEFTIPLDGTIKILTGTEANDMLVGGCYYVTLTCGTEFKSLVHGVKRDIGQPQDVTQQFHLSIATIAPSWMHLHPKSRQHLDASTSKQTSMLSDALHKFRHGDNGYDFDGFNNDATTGWTNHSKKVSDANRSNQEIDALIRDLPQNEDTAGSKSRLRARLVDVRSFGFQKSVGTAEEITKIRTPDQHRIGKMTLDFAMMWNQYGRVGIVRTKSSGSLGECEAPPRLSRSMSACARELLQTGERLFWHNKILS